MGKRTIRDLDLMGKRVLMRSDFNVPLDGAGRIADDTRIRETLPSIQYCLTQKARLILLSHLGRPDGARRSTYSLRPVAQRLSELLRQPVGFVEDCVGPTVEQRVSALAPGEAVLLENVRFYPEEERNDPAFARRLAQLGEIYVNDAFGTAHRAHASTEGIAHSLPAVAGLLMEKEIRYLSGVLTHPQRPLVAILGGAKVSDKIKVVDRLLEQTDRVLIGGGMAYTFLKAQGHAIGSSKLEPDRLVVAKEIMAKAAARSVQLLLPTDHVITTTLDPNGPVRTTQDVTIPDGWLGVDIGPKTIQAFTPALADAKTVIWNGPLGVFEQPRFAVGSQRIAESLATLQHATTVIGGGDTAACVKQSGVADRMSHISTGGGASLEYLEGKVLPGIAVLQDK
ncbi:MAG: phosphoglycerate kinase [Candidatus Omnitrophica bacterium]|nr:phosphoglycerate kinase [Candidatus Omnitrophota bacterium]